MLRIFMSPGAPGGSALSHRGVFDLSSRRGCRLARSILASRTCDAFLASKVCCLAVFVPCQTLPQFRFMTDSYDLLISAAPEPKPDLDIVDTWQRAIGADPSHPYLTRYGLPRQSLRQIGDYLVAPLTDRRGRLIGLRLVDADGVEDIYPASAAKACFAMERDGATTTIIVQGSVADAVAIHASMAARVLLVPTTRDALQLHEQLIAEKLAYAVRVAFSSQALAAASCAVGEQNPSVVASPPNLTWAGLYALQGAAGVAS